jgi:hypothetical protein
MKKQTIKKSLLSILFALLAVTSMTGWIDSKGSEYTEATFKRALIAFGIAKGLNGVISVAQGTEVALQPAGVGVNFAPGQILDPVNDMIEQFSWIMLASTASVGVQRILLAISQWPWFSYTVIVLLLLAAISYWYRPLTNTQWRPLLFKTMLVFVFLRFSVPLIAIGSEMTYEQFLSEQYTQSTQQLELTTSKITEINNTDNKAIPQGKDRSVLEAIKEMYGNAAAAFDFGARIDRYKHAAADAIEHVINLIVVFIFQTILFPILFLLVVYQLLKKLIRLEWMRF